MTNNTKAFVVTIFISVAVVIAGVVLMNSNATSEQKQEGSPTDADLVGKPMPNVQLMDKDGKPYPMESLRGKNVVLFFNEGLMCYPACWEQMTAFGADPRFNGNDTAALSVIVDSPQDWQRAIAKMPALAKATTLFDAGAATSRRLGILSMGSSMHKGQLPGHTYILLDREGIVREVFDDPNMSINNDALIQRISKF